MAEITTELEVKMTKTTAKTKGEIPEFTTEPKTEMLENAA